MKKIILASSSPRRKSLIQTLRIPYEVISSDVNEDVDTNLRPEQVVTELALRKATAVYKDVKSRESLGVVVGADTIVVYEDEIFGKPRSEKEAFETLKRLQGKTHQVYSGMACVSLHDDKQTVDYRKTNVTMKALTDEEIDGYIKSGEPMDKAGSYGIQGLGALFVEEIEGDFFGVMGLSLNLLYKMLQEFGFNPLNHK